MYKVFRERFRVLTYGARAQGRSDLGSRPLSPERHVADLLGLTDFLNISRAHLAGMSHGAHVALTFSWYVPERADRLVLCGVGAYRSHRTEKFICSWREILDNSGFKVMVRAFLPTVFGDRFLQANEKVPDKMITAIVRREKNGIASGPPGCRVWLSPPFPDRTKTHQPGTDSLWRPGPAGQL